MTSKSMRDNPIFMRNNFDSVGKWGIPLIQKQELSTDDIMLVACSDTRANDKEENRKKGITEEQENAALEALIEEKYRKMQEKLKKQNGGQ